MAKAFPVAKIIKNLVAIGIPANGYIARGLKSIFSTADFKK